MRDENDLEKEVVPFHMAYFHGEDWYKCPSCGGNFEYFQAFFNENKCPNCGQKIKIV